MDFSPTLEFPLILEKPGNPHKWVKLHNDDGSLTVPALDERGRLCLFTYEGKEYFIEAIDANTSILKLQHRPYTHWFTKPISPDSRIPNHICPILMEEGVDYLVGIHGKLRFINTIGLFRDALLITVWFNDKELFPIR